MEAAYVTNWSLYDREIKSKAPSTDNHCYSELILEYAIVWKFPLHRELNHNNQIIKTLWMLLKKTFDIDWDSKKTKVNTLAGNPRKLLCLFCTL